MIVNCSSVDFNTKSHAGSLKVMTRKKNIFCVFVCSSILSFHFHEPTKILPPTRFDLQRCTVYGLSDTDREKRCFMIDSCHSPLSFHLLLLSHSWDSFLLRSPRRAHVFVYSLLSSPSCDGFARDDDSKPIFSRLCRSVEWFLVSKKWDWKKYLKKLMKSQK